MNNANPNGLTPDHIVNHVRSIRPSWDHAGIRKAVRDALNSYPLGIVRQAAIAAAGDPKVRTPGVIDARCQLIVESERRRQVDAGAAAVETGRPPADLPAHHCMNPNCMCDHSRCFAGWADPGDKPCPECRPALTASWIAAGARDARPAARADLAPGRGELLAQVRAQLAARREGSA